MKENKKVAVFIDAENISARFADKLLAEAANYGDVIIRRVYADWSSSNVQAWKEVISRHSLLAEQQFNAVKGKNSGDISLIINAMIVLFERDIDVFCLASSDSDFTRLVQVLREREKTVIGLGLKQTAQAFVNAFSEFIYLDSENGAQNGKDKQIEEKKATKVQPVLEDDRLNALREVVDKLIEEDGWALFARIATEMKNKFSDFVPRNYNCRSLKELVFKVLPLLGNYEIGTAQDGTTMFLIPGQQTLNSLKEKKNTTSTTKQKQKKTAKKQEINEKKQKSYKKRSKKQ